jgi:hypothetical protein
MQESEFWISWQIIYSHTAKPESVVDLTVTRKHSRSCGVLNFAQGVVSLLTPSNNMQYSGSCSGGLELLSFSGIAQSIMWLANDGRNNVRFLKGARIFLFNTKFTSASGPTHVTRLLSNASFWVTKKLPCVLIHHTRQTWHPVISGYSQKLNWRWKETVLTRFQR